MCFFPLYLAEVEQLRDAEVLVADPKVATPFLFNMPKLKWLQSTWAGEEHWRNAWRFITLLFYVFSPPHCQCRCQNDQLQWGLCAYVIVHIILPPSPVILWIELGGKPKWLPLNSGYHDVMCTAPSQNVCVQKSFVHDKVLEFVHYPHAKLCIWQIRCWYASSRWLDTCRSTCITFFPDIRSCLTINLGRETDGNNEVCLGIRFALCMTFFDKLGRIVLQFLIHFKKTTRTMLVETLNKKKVVCWCLGGIEN